jgi:hypothetical protein
VLQLSSLPYCLAVLVDYNLQRSTDTSTRSLFLPWSGLRLVTRLCGVVVGCHTSFIIERALKRQRVLGPQEGVVVAETVADGVPVVW